jgi:exodeoxyribonuclease V gamma subunit
MAIDLPGNGIVVYRASRLEALLEPLETLLAASPPAALLAPQTVLAAHPGMRRWLRQALAQRRGREGIVANLDVQLPGAWFEARARRVLGMVDADFAAYRRDALGWRLYGLLAHSRDPEVMRALGDGDPRRRHGLADHLAALYTRYMVYRPDWLARWQAGAFEVPRANALAPLWRSLRREIPSPHRGEWLQDLIRRLESMAIAAEDEPLHVFGLSHLAPIELALLRAEARHRLVVLYLPDPCVEYWAGLGNTPARLQALLAEGDADARERSLLALGHPLLAAWGRIGQHFGLSLNAGEGRVLSETRHWLDSNEPDADGSVLHAVQHGIRLLKPELTDAALHSRADAARDPSLRVHGCHTRLRELEVLRDVMLDALRRDLSLHPSQMIVMAPNIAAYAPLVPAVFGASPEAQAELPYHLADIAIRRTHPCFSAFAALLGLPSERISREQVLDLLAQAPVARALGLDADRRESLRTWLSQARVAWGLDASSRLRFELPAYPEHSFAWGVERLLSGYLYGDDDAAAGTRDAAADQVQSWPLGGVHGLDVEALGALDRLLGELDAFARATTEPRPLSAWCRLLEGLLQRLFVVDPADAGERDALARLHRLLGDLRAGAEGASADPELDFLLLRDLLLERLEAIPEQQPFLLGGATFCGMVPQRSLPFRFIAVLGLNDGEYPRSAGDGGLDLMAQSPRLGDRDVRNDDRYLFLETLMAAREQLHLSFLSEGVRDGKAMNPAAPLAELLAFLDQRSGWSAEDERAFAAAADGGRVLRPWRLQHALQPFDPRYYGGAEDAPFFSFRAGDGAARVVAAAGGRFVSAGERAPLAESATGIVDLDLLRRWYRDPAAVVLADRLGVRLDALAEREDDGEPLRPELPRRERLPRRFVFDALARGAFEAPPQPSAALRLSGQLPIGALAQMAYADARDDADDLLRMLRDDADFRLGLAAPTPVEIELTLGGQCLRGRLERVHRSDRGWLLCDAFPGKRESELGFRERVPWLIDWALLRLTQSTAECRARLLVTDGESDASWRRRVQALDLATLGERLLGLVAFMQAGQAQPLGYFPRTSWAIAQAKPEQRRAKAREAWSPGGGRDGEADFAPGHAGWLARGVDLFDPEGEDWARLEANALALARLIDAEPAR